MTIHLKYIQNSTKITRFKHEEPRGPSWFFFFLISIDYTSHLAVEKDSTFNKVKKLKKVKLGKKLASFSWFLIEISNKSRIFKTTPHWTFMSQYLFCCPECLKLLCSWLWFPLRCAIMLFSQFMFWTIENSAILYLYNTSAYQKIFLI